MSGVASASAAAAGNDDDLHPAESWECTAGDGGGGLSEAALRERVDQGGSSCSAGRSFRVQPPGLLAATCLVINCESLSRIIVEYCWSVVDDDGDDRRRW